MAAPPIHRQIALRGKRRSRIQKEQSISKKVKRGIVDSGYYTIPEGDAYLDHREAQLPCPDQYHCVDGLAKPKLLWAAGNGCASNVVGEIMTVKKF